MTQVKNTATGPRMLTMSGRKQIFLQPGETKDVPLHRIPHLPDGVIQVDAEDLDLSQVEGEDIPDQPVEQGGDFQILGDGTVKPAGDAAGKSKGKAKPSTHEDLEAAKSKAALIEIADKEGIDVEIIEGTGAGGNVLMDDIKAAIIDKRAQAA